MKKLTRAQIQDLGESVSREQALASSKEYFGGGNMEATNFLNKYALKDFNGRYYEKTPDDMHNRLADAFAEVEDAFPNGMSRETIYDLLKDFNGPIPQGSVMSAVRNPFQLISTANCFVVLETDDDSYGNIMKTDEELAQIMKRRGGVGTDLSHLRPRTSVVQNAARTSTGAVSFAHRYSNTTREVAQNNRRGALMLTLDCRHPDLEEFINLKAEKGAVTGANISVKFHDDFMEAVKNNDTYTLRYPVDVEPEDADMTKEVDAKRLFDLFVRNNYGPGDVEGAEPGAIWMDEIHRESPAGCYPGFKEISTNPCFSGDTKIAVADGRGAVSIKELAEQGDDVDVYAANPETGDIEIKRGRNPRVTGTDKQVVRVTFSRGSHVDVTPDHPFLMKDGSKKQAKDLDPGDSIAPFTKYKEDSFGNGNEYWRINTNFKDTNQRTLEHRLIARHSDKTKWDELYDENKKSGWMSGGLVVHHKDYDGLNNDPENLEIMTFKEHNKYHADHDTKGTKNGRWCGTTNQELREIGIGFAENLGRRFSKKEWHKYADKHNLPKDVSGEYRSTDEYSNVTEFGKWCADQADVSQFNGIDPRVAKTFFRMLRQGYTTEIREIGENRHEVYVEKTCEHCGSTFMKHHQQREVSYCSLSCSSQRLSQSQKMQDVYRDRSERFQQEANQKRQRQLDVFTSLAFEMDRDPYIYEWKDECERRGISKRLRTKYGFDNYTDLKEHAEAYNHRVQSVEYLGERETVYNITVDDHHTVGIITEDENNKTGIFAFQCGELPLPDGDSCRLLAINLYPYVENPFTDQAWFNFERFRREVRASQRIMDDVVEIELNHISWIIEKVKNDPEDPVVKQRELNLWNRILETCRKGRRTGLGTTALGDTLAALGIRYGSNESIQKADEIYREFKLAAYRESVELAKERGPFPMWDPDIEKDNPFLLRIQEQDPELYADMQKHGRRNIALLTNAPTGTVSTLAQTSSGIENVFMPYYFRKRKLNHDEMDVEPDYVDDVGDRWIEFPVFHHKLKTWFQVQGIENPEELSRDELDEYIAQSPYHGATVADVDWRNKVRLQAAIQSHIDHSISVTVNLPEDVDMETVRDLYMISHESGCKGCTIYREGSRDAVLSNESVKDETQEIQHNDAPDRPETLECDIHRIRYGGDNWKIIVGFLNENPYEVFGFKTGGGTGNIVRFTDSDGKSIDRGIVRKKGGGVYHLESLDGKTIVKDIAEYAPDDEARSMTRMISLALRHGARLEYVIEQLEKAEGSVVSFSKAVLRAIREYVDESNKHCMECEDGGRVVYQEGCFKCLECGSSRCG